MRFVRTKTLAGELRAQHIADYLGVPCDREYTEPDEWVVFVKKFDGMEKAKKDGCLVALDPVDYYCYSDGRNLSGSEFVDLLIIPNKECAKGYKDIFPNADFLAIPHQWDHRISGETQHDTFRAGYIGRKFNLDEVLNIEMVTEEEDQLSAMTRFNCHVSKRTTKAEGMVKPATKIASASAVNAVIVTTPDASSKYLLGEHYPFYSIGTLFDAIYSAKKAFGTQKWEDAREIMREVKHRTSLETVADFYRMLS